MRFRLVYQGELRSGQRDRYEAEPIRISEHKQAIRKVFHRQLKHLWATNPFLSTHKVWPNDYGITAPVADSYLAVFSDDPDKRIPLADAVAFNYQEYGYRFVPLVRKEWKVNCSLEILFLRHDPPGSVVTAGDLDNRLKTLIDALRKPNGETELRGNEAPSESEDPFFCLLEDDHLIAGLSVETDRFLEPPKGKKDSDRREVQIVITVDIRPYYATTFNLSFA